MRRVCSVCTGAFYLAAAGLLDGCRATTHWREAPLLARRFPDVKVDADPIFIRDDSEQGVVWTSAGVTAGIDLALALIEEDVGHAVGMQAARRLVVFMKRPGGQSQFSAALAAQLSADGPFEALHSWMATNLRDDLSVEWLAERAQMNPRTFARRYVDEVGRMPAKTVSTLWLEAASHALAEPRKPLKRIATDCGFGSEQNLRRAFVRRFGVLPLDYRERFMSASTAATRAASWCGVAASRPLAGRFACAARKSAEPKAPPRLVSTPPHSIARRSQYYARIIASFQASD